MDKKTKIKFNIIIILAIILFTIATTPKTLQEDTYYMIKVGEYICQNGMQVIENRIEPFAWHDGMIYTYPHWLLDIIFYLIFNAFDLLGIYIFSIVSGIIIYLLIYYTNIKAGKNNIISAIMTIASIYILTGYITARAQVITYICCILTILFIESFLEKGRKRYLIGLIIVPIILANCHAAMFPIYFVIYLPYIAAYIFSYITKKELYTRAIKRINKTITKLKEKNNTKKLSKLERKEKRLIKLNKKLEKIEEKDKTTQKKIIVERNPNVKWLIIIFIICIFTGLLTPLKDIPYTYMIKSIQGNTMNFIAEHQNVVLIQDIILLIIFALIQVLLFYNKTKIKLQDLFMIIGMTILALISYKQLPIFIICTICIINKLAYQAIPDETRKKIIAIISKLLTVRNTIYIILIILILALLQYKSIAKQNYIDNNSYPVEASTWIKGNINTKEMKLFNDFNYGSYLLFKDIPVFIDGRADAYDPVFNGKKDDVFLDYMETASLKVWYKDVFEKYGITHIIIKTNSDLNLFLQRDISYKSIYNDGTFTIYECK